MDNIEKGIKLINLISDLGYEAYIVGGAVRDYLLEIDVNDVDITTSMPIDKIKEHFDVIDNGSKYLSVTINYLDTLFEITNFRKEINYLDHRHPEVIYTDNIYEDLERRDFTINALLIDKDGMIIDKFFGINDLKNKIIKTIGNPNKRFNEDALRILRALYLYAKLDFLFDDDTLTAMYVNKKLLGTLSEERLYEYFKKLLQYKTPKLLNFISVYDLFISIHPYMKWLLVASKDNTDFENILAYYKRYQEYPPVISKDEIKLIDIYQNIVNQKYDKYVLYENYKLKNELIPIFIFMGVDSNIINHYFDELMIKDDKELALSKKEISDLVEPKNRSKVIELVIRAILDGKLKNEKEDIRNYVLGMII